MYRQKPINNGDIIGKNSCRKIKYIMQDQPRWRTMSNYYQDCKEKWKAK